MKKVILIATLLALGFSMAFLNAAPGKYDDINAFMTKSNSTLEAFVSGLEKVTDAKSFAATINTTTDTFKAMLPALKELFVKYPNLNELTETNVPEELKAGVDKGKVINAKIQPLFIKLMPLHQSDPEVMKAVQAMQQFQMEMSNLKPKQEKAPEAAAPATEKKE